MLERCLKQVDLDLCSQHNSDVNLSKKVVSFLLGLDSSHLQHITFGTLFQVLSIDSDDEVAYSHLVKVTDYLTSYRLHLLDMQFHFIDSELSDPFPVDKSELHQALKSGLFYHPLTGLEVFDFKDRIYPYFEPSEELQQYRAGDYSLLAAILKSESNSDL
ncbi:hypothetical protein [Grimontia hollisae]|uniref:hypothetical protein n=1 Tax=Grimontia hollisae TaxID=673 RepID=UPI00165E795A|nr:hypothetical protein [Grimontia hollisae]